MKWAKVFHYEGYDTLGSEVINYLYTEGEPLEKAVKGIDAGMSEDEKTKMRDNREWIERVNELVELEKDHDQHGVRDIG